MLDLRIEGGTIADGNSGEPFTGDVGVKDGRIVEVSRTASGSAARETIDANGAWVMPGFVDIHTHYDGQATWDASFSPSIFHGVTTCLLYTSDAADE